MPNGAIDLTRMAEHFFGYGRWEAPYWFIGPEAGMTQEGDTLALRYESWQALGLHAVVDCAAHSQGIGCTKWHRLHPPAPTQPTWRKLIRLLLSYKGQPNDIEAIRDYQRLHWGSSIGETCVIELSGLAAPNMQIPQDRTTFRNRRIAHIREQAQTRSPRFIVMYGIEEKVGKEITGAPFQANGHFLISRMGTTVVTLAKHPVAWGSGTGYWTSLGRLLRELTGE